MTFSEETLMAYADNELDAHTRSAVEAAMAADPEVARKVARHKALRRNLRTAFDKVLDEPPPQRLIDAARGVPAIRREGNVIPLRRKPASRGAWPQWTSLAATLVLGVLIGQVLLRTSGGSGPITARDGKLLANGVLAQALAEQLASTQKNELPVQIGVSFKSKDGDYCRTFSLHDSTTFAGVACHSQEAWEVRSLAQSDQGHPAGSTYRQAGSELPRSITQAVEDMIAGEPLDARAENLAREKNWKAR